MRRSVFVWCLSVCLGCGTPGGGPADDSDDAGRRAEEQARSLAAPHEAKGRDCEAEGKLREALKHYVAAIQALPEGNATAKDFELREKSIRIVLSLDPPPAISEDVQQMFDRAEATAKAAKDAVAYSNAAQEYERALRYAPWPAQPNYNLGLLYELMNKPPAAIRSLKLYLVAAPQAPDRDAVQKKVADLEVKMTRTGVGALQGVWRIHKESIETDYLSLDNGGSVHGWRPPKKNVVFRIVPRGGSIDLTIVFVQDDAWWGERLKGEECPYATLAVKGRRLDGKLDRRFFGYEQATDQEVTGVVSEDFEDIKISCCHHSGPNGDYWYTFWLKREN